MRRACIPFLIFAAVALVAATGNQEAAQLPPYASAYEPQTVDERGLWMQFDELERDFRNSPLVIRDEVANAYVRGVLCRTVGEDRCSSVRIYIIQVPAFNASMAPNGMMLVHSGLLLRARNEAELGSVLGHEFAHFELRHSLKQFKRDRLATDLIAWAGAIGAAAGTNTFGLQWSLYGASFSFSRQQEQEADRLGLQYLAAARYPASAAAGIWEHLMAENDATAVGRKQKPGRRYTAAFFDTHPTEARRAKYLRDAAAAFPGPDHPGADGHEEGIANLLPMFLADQVKLNDFGGTEYLLEELASRSGWTAELLFARGELYRQRGYPRDLVSAAQFYREAISSGYAEPEGRRNLGLALLRSGQTEDGRAALAEYLRLKPDASDSAAISALIES